MSEGLVIPVSADNTKAKEGIAEVFEAFETLGKEAKKAGTSGAQATNAMAAGAQQAAASTNTLASRYTALNARFEQAQKSQNLFTRGGQAMAGSLNGLFSSLAGEVGEFTRGSDGATQSLVNLGAQALPALGPVGAALAALAGGVALVTRMEREQAEELRTLNSLYDVQARLGPLYNNIASQIDGAATAQERFNQLRSAAQGILTAQRTMIEQGFNPEQIRTFTNVANNALPAIRAVGGELTNTVSAQQVLEAVTSRNTAQLRQWGINVTLGADASENMGNAMHALATRTVENAQATRQNAEAGVRNLRAQLSQSRASADQSDAIERETDLGNRLRSAQTSLTEARAAEERAVQALVGRTGQLAEALREEARVNAEALRDAPTSKRAAAANVASLMDRRAATLALAEAMRNQRRAQEQLDARDPATRFEVERRQREEQAFHLRRQIALATEEYNIRRQASENIAQFDQRRAAALQRVADLTLELSQSEREATERLNAAKERSLEIGAQLQTGAREAALRSITEAQEELNRSTARYAAEQSGSYQTRDAQLAQLDREVAVRATLIGRLQEQRRAAEGIADLQARAQALAAISSQQNGLEAQQQAALSQRRQLATGQLQQMENAVKRLADSSVNAAGTAGQAFDALTGAMGSSAAAYFKGEKTFEEASQAMVNSTLSAISEIASKEMIMQLAAGTAALFTKPPAAAAHFAAAGLYGLVAAGTGAAAAATKPSTASAGGAGSEPRRPTSSDDAATAAATGQVTVTNYYAPVIEGRAATQDQVGMRLNRYQRAGAMRLERHS